MEVLKIGDKALFSITIEPHPEAVRRRDEARRDYDMTISDPSIVTDRNVWEAANDKYKSLVELSKSKVPQVTRTMIFGEEFIFPLPTRPRLLGYS